MDAITDKLQTEEKGIPPCWLPPEKVFEAEFCGADPINYVYIRCISDPRNIENYKNLRANMDLTYQKLVENKTLSEPEIEPNLYIVVKDEDGKSFHRAVIIKQNDEVGWVQCLKIDEGTCVVVGRRQIFPLTEEFRIVPRTVIKCKLQGLEFFDSVPHLELGYKLIKMAEIHKPYTYSAQVVEMKEQIPCVNLTRFGMSLTNEIQKFIPMLCEPIVPMPEIPFEGEILHAHSKSILWFRQYDDDGLAWKIQDCLNLYKFNQEKEAAKIWPRPDLYGDDADKMKICQSNSENCNNLQNGRMTNPESTDCIHNPGRQLLPEEVWKEKYFVYRQKNPNGIFVTEFQDDLYRVRILKFLKKTKQAEVEFIDFGNRKLVSCRKLIPARKIDENLAFIPPQCLQARLHGFYRINTYNFWKLMPPPDQPAVEIMIKDKQGCQSERMEIDIFKPGSEESISETWTSSSSELLVMCSLENSTGTETTKDNTKVRPTIRKRRASLPIASQNPQKPRQRGALYMSDRISVLLERISS